MKLKTVEKAVKYSLENSEEARKNDFVLYVDTLRNMGFDVSYLEQFFKQNGMMIPSFESVTRCRRLVQSQIPELKDKHIDNYRRKVKEPEYREFSKTKVESLDNYGK